MPQVHVLAARSWAQRCELCVRDGTGERERPTRHPGREKEQGARHQRRHLRWSEEDAAADHIGDDDRCRIEWTEPTRQNGRVFPGRLGR